MPLIGQRNQAVGELGERAAAEYLVSRGYSLLERNFRSRGGEVDIVAKDRDGCIVFVEVKTRRSLTYGLPQLAVTPRKQHQISKGALAWLSRNRRHDCPARFDVIAVLLQDGVAPRIEHIPNAFDLAY
nr:YraN family protein [Trichlorobacter lovleyi]